MRVRYLPAGLIAMAVLAGCASHAPKTGSQLAYTKANSRDRVIVTPAKGLSGTVVRVNDTLRYAVLNFPFGTLPPKEQKINVYRRGLKVGEVLITGPQQDDNIVADVVTGEVQAGDNLRTD